MNDFSNDEETLRLGSDPVKGVLEPYLASSSVDSFPGIPQCPGTHTNITGLFMDGVSVFKHQG